MSWLFSSVTYSNDVQILNPNGTVFRNYQGTGNGTFFEPLTLSQTGTYTIFISGQGSATGSHTVRVYEVPPDATAVATIGGPAVTTTTTIPGQNARVTFDGTAGQLVSWLFSSVTYSNDVQILNPNGTVFRNYQGTGNGTFFEPLTLSQTGTYTIFISGQGSATGSHTVRVYEVPPDATAVATIGGPAVTTTTTIPGQNARVTFDGTAGQLVSWLFSSVTYSNDVQILNPNGTVFRNYQGTGNGTFFEPLTLSQTGTYTIFISGQGSATGSHTVRVDQVPPDATAVATIGGPAVTTTTTIPGQNARVTFDGTAGQLVSWLFSSVTYSNDVQILNPNGTVFRNYQGTGNGTFFEPLTLSQTGTYTIFISGQGSATGSHTVRVVQAADATAVATIGGPAVTTTTTIPGQNARVTFDGTAGQLVSWLFSSVTYSNDVQILNPNGTVFRNYQGTGNGTFFEPLTLSQTGTYTIFISGQGSATGSHTVRVYEVPPDATAVATIGGPAVTTTTTIPGQNARVTFDGTAGQLVSWLFSSVTYSNDVQILNPNGTVFRNYQGTGNGTFFEPLTLSQTGTYTIFISGQGSATGSHTVRVYEVPPDVTAVNATIGGPAVTTTTTIPGQNARVTFDGTAGQLVSWLFSSVTYSNDVQILNPNGTVFRNYQGTGNGTVFSTMTLGQTGTYTIFVNGQGSATGTHGVTVRNEGHAAAPAPVRFARLDPLANTAGIARRTRRPPAGRPTACPCRGQARQARRGCCRPSGATGPRGVAARRRQPPWRLARRPDDDRMAAAAAALRGGRRDRAVASSSTSKDSRSSTSRSPSTGSPRRRTRPAASCSPGLSPASTNSRSTARLPALPAVRTASSSRGSRSRTV